MGRIGVGFFYALSLEGYMGNPKPPNHRFGSKPPILVPSHPVPWLLSLLEFSLVEVPFNWLKVVVVFLQGSVLRPSSGADDGPESSMWFWRLFGPSYCPSKAQLIARTAAANRSEPMAVRNRRIAPSSFDFKRFRKIISVVDKKFGLLLGSSPRK